MTNKQPDRSNLRLYTVGKNLTVEPIRDDAIAAVLLRRAEPADQHMLQRQQVAA